MPSMGTVCISDVRQTRERSHLTKSIVYLAGTFVFLLLYIAIIIDHVGLGGGEIVTGYGLPVLLLVMLALYTALPTLTNRSQGSCWNETLRDIK